MLLIALGGFLILSYFGLYLLLNCFNALWYFSFKLTIPTLPCILIKSSYFQAFFAIGLGTWLLIKGKEYLPCEFTNASSSP